MNKRVFYGCLISLFGFLIWSIFSKQPFLQQEMLGQLTWWTHNSTGILDTLFDPSKNDTHPGRFRYVEYLFEALYWKVFTAGFLPRDLYDYSAFLFTGILCVLLIQIAKHIKLHPQEVLLCLALFLLSSQTFMIHVYHFRKAKIITSVLLILTVFFLQKEKKSGIRWGAVLTGLVGFFTDPTFILLVPLVALCMDTAYDQKKLPRFGSVLLGLGLGFCGLIVINGVIGPLFNPGTRLILTEIIQKPYGLLNPQSIPLFFDILRDLLAPMGFSGSKAILGWLSLGLFLSFVVACLVRAPMKCPFLILFLLSLPVGAFLVRPAHGLAMHGGYYGHPLMVLFVLAWMDIFKCLRNISKPAYHKLAYGTLVLIIGLCQVGKKDVFAVWESHHLNNSITKAKFDNDYREISNIREFLKLEAKEPFVLSLDYSKMGPLLFDSIYEFGELGTERDRTLLAYVGIPHIFKREIAEGKIRIIRK